MKFASWRLICLVSDKAGTKPFPEQNILLILCWLVKHEKYYNNMAADALVAFATKASGAALFTEVNSRNYNSSYSSILSESLQILYGSHWIKLVNQSFWEQRVNIATMPDNKTKLTGWQSIVWSYTGDTRRIPSMDPNLLSTQGCHMIAMAFQITSNWIICATPC